MSFSAEEAWARAKTLAPFPGQLYDYYKDILSQYDSAHRLAREAKARGLDPRTTVEPNTVFDLADRVNQLLGLGQFEGLVERLRELLRTTTKEKSALTISQEIALGKFGAMPRREALDYGVRAGLAVMTDGVTVAPIQGIYHVAIKQNDDNSSYASVSYAGPMRSAGGTEAGFSLVIADVTAKKLGLSSYKASTQEIDRFAEEMRIYEREVGNFQYKVTDEDIRFAISNLPVEIDGVETDPIEVVVHRNLKRVSTDRLRGGALRVLNDGIIGRGHKLAKKLASLNISGWEWLSEIKGGTQESTNETEQAGAHFEEVISGRAVLSMPRRRGGFRLRYGRSMNTGLSSIGIHPAVPALLDYPVVVGTQVKVDLPGKAATVAFVDSLEGPTVLLVDGTVKHVSSEKEGAELRERLVRIIDLGDALVSYGDFLENNKNLPPSPYVTEWWTQDLKQALSSVPEATTKLNQAGITAAQLEALVSGGTPTAVQALSISRTLSIPLHPTHTPRFDRLTGTDILELRANCRMNGLDVEANITSHHIQWMLQNSLLEHQVIGNKAIIHGEAAVILSELLRLGQDSPLPDTTDALEATRQLSGIRLGRQTTTTIGVRVGRPEKAMVRRMKPPVHTLFPVGNAGGPWRDVFAAAKADTISVEVVNLFCPSCNERKLSVTCDTCGERTQMFRACPRCGLTTTDPLCPNCKSKTNAYSPLDLSVKARLEKARSKLLFDNSKPIKGVRGLTSQSKMPEPLEKGIIRSLHGVFVYKDGTLRIDITNAPLTHFRPSDIGTGIETMLSLGYTTDYQGRPLTEETQLLELKPQDIIVPQGVTGDLVRMAQFADDELQNFYGLPTFYNVQRADDLVGRIVVGLAPHTSVGVVGRIIGFSPTQVCFANPCWHAAKRRDCDGDGDSLLLLVDALINFSIEYIPDQIGGLMDTPLLLQPILVPSEVDEQAHNFDVAYEYPREFYEKTQGSPAASSLASSIERIGSRLTNENQFHGYGFTHTTSALTIRKSRAAYSTLRALAEKVSKQIEVASKIEAVSTKEVVESIIRTHLIRDIMGNAKKYATQAFKCKKCGATIRRPPLSWACPTCGGEVKETLTQASVEKYVSLAQRLAREYNVDLYLRSRLDVIQRELDQLFQGRRKADQLELTDFAATLTEKIGV